MEKWLNHVNTNIVMLINLQLSLVFNRFLKGTIFLALLVLAHPRELSAQGEPIENLRTVVPPSPNASSLGKFTQWPVSLYTGLPSIDISLYEVKDGDISVPISLSYHSSGIKVGEISSWVGLGFVINAGGMITRSVVGLPDDEQSQGYFHWRGLYSDPSDLLSSAPDEIWKTHVAESAKGTADSQHDLYILNALGRSYKLLFKGNGTIVTMPYSALKVSHDFVNEAWTIILEDGTKLVFGSDSQHYETTTANFGSTLGSLSYKSTWHLKTIISVEGREIVFSYNQQGIVADRDYTQSDYIKAGRTYPPQACLTYSHGTVKTTSRQTDVSSLVLSQIESDLERIEFVQAEDLRLDLQGGKALKVVKRFSKLKGAYLDQFELFQTYSTAASGGGIGNQTSYMTKRLKLISLKKTSVDGLNGETWSFEYDPQSLPARNSASQDHWGYYNGASNTTLLPPLFLDTSNPNVAQVGFFPSFHPIGANRESDSVKMKAESLTAINYPWGGRTKFDMEANRYPVTEEVLTTETVECELNLNNLTSPYVATQTKPFTITQGQYVYLTFEGYISPAILEDRPSAVIRGQILDSQGNLIVEFVENGERYYILREPGSYSLRVTTNVNQDDFMNSTDAISMYASLRYEKSQGVQTFQKLVGGLRVKSITDFDGMDASKEMKRFYFYSNEYVINPIDPNIDYLTTTQEYSKSPYCILDIYTRNASTKFSLGSIQGGVIGYGRVMTLYGMSGAGGKTVSIFTNETDSGLDNSREFPYPPSDNRDWKRGLLISQTDYTASNMKVKRIANHYSFNTIASVICFKAGSQGYDPDCHPTDLYSNCYVVRMPYSITTEQIKHDGSEEVLYSVKNDVLDSIVNKTEMFFDNPNNLNATRTQTIDSKGDVQTKRTFSPLEKDLVQGVEAATLSAIDSMIQRNILNPVVQEEMMVNTTVIQRNTIDYKVWHSVSGNGQYNIVAKPSAVTTQMGTSTPQRRLVMSNYDTRGNLVTQQKSKDAEHSYIYDYQNRFPIAEVINSSIESSAYTSFEAEGSGTWNITGANVNDDSAPTGSKSHTLSQGNVSRSGLNSSISYIVSFWYKGTLPSVAGGSMVQLDGKIGTAGWTYYKAKLNNASSVTISGSASIDELRIYPAQATMKTYTYEPLWGITSATDENGKTTYYEYDGLGRLVFIRDDEGNIKKSYKYHYGSESSQE